jgi:putative ABC transport system ATP-binding protein
VYPFASHLHVGAFVALHLQHLKKQYIGPDGSVVPVINVESLSLGDGEHVALIGTSGSGKTTLLHMIAGIVAPDSGRIIYDFRGNQTAPATPAGKGNGVGETRAVAADNTLNYRSEGSARQEALPPGVIDIGSLSEAQRDVFRGGNVGYIFQTHHLLGGFTALENVLLGMSFTGRKPDRTWARRLLNDVGLSERADYRPEKLSVGQQQRVAVARALANRPKLVLADEPTGALDPATAKQVLGLIRNLCTEVGASLLLVTHDLDIAHQLSRVVTLSEINRASAGKPAPVTHTVMV